MKFKWLFSLSIYKKTTAFWKWRDFSSFDSFCVFVRFFFVSVFFYVCVLCIKSNSIFKEWYFLFLRHFPLLAVSLKNDLYPYSSETIFSRRGKSNFSLAKTLDYCPNGYIYCFFFSLSSFHFFSSIFFIIQWYPVLEIALYCNTWLPERSRYLLIFCHYFHHPHPLRWVPPRFCHQKIFPDVDLQLTIFFHEPLSAWLNAVVIYTCNIEKGEKRRLIFEKRGLFVNF